MNRRTKIGPNRDITGDACAWLAQLETGELTPADRDAFREWMHRNPLHVREIRRLAALSKNLNVLTGMTDSIEQASDHYEFVLKRRERFGFRPMAAAAAAAATLILAAVIIIDPSATPYSPSIELQTASYETDVGGQREVPLADGTKVVLNTDSKLLVRYTDAERHVELVKGEAYFDVEPDAARPFLVEANGRRVRAVGTAFAVKMLDSDFTVMVVEGRVELSGLKTRRDGGVSRDDRPVTSNEPVLLDAGQKAIQTSLERVAHISIQSPREQQRNLSWQDGIHDFSAMPLEDVIREINRYTRLEIEIVDPALRKIKFGGVFRIGDTQQLLEALMTSYGIDVQREGDSKIRLSRAIADGVTQSSGAVDIDVGQR